MNTLATLSGRMGRQSRRADIDAPATDSSRLRPEPAPPSGGSIATAPVYVRTRRAANAASVRCPTCRPTRRWPSSPAGTRPLSSRSTCCRPGSASGALSPDDALASVRTVRNVVVDAHAVGDLDGLLTPAGRAAAGASRAQRAARRAERTRQHEETRAAKETVRRSRRSGSPPATTGAAGSTGSAPCWTSGRRCPGSTGPPTTSCGTASPAPGPRTPGGVRPSSPPRAKRASRPG